MLIKCRRRKGLFRRKKGYILMYLFDFFYTPLSYLWRRSRNANVILKTFPRQQNYFVSRSLQPPALANVLRDSLEKRSSRYYRQFRKHIYLQSLKIIDYFSGLGFYLQFCFEILELLGKC